MMRCCTTCGKKYVAHLRRGDSSSPGRGTKAVMPGIRPLLDALERRDDVFLGLLTGNFESGARIKLEHFDLWRYFRCGAFGDDSADRNALVPFALARARVRPPDLAAAHILVVGDTPHDVACARTVGAVPVAVATGTFSVEQLRATGADVVFQDLSDTGAFLQLLENRFTSRSSDCLRGPTGSPTVARSRNAGERRLAEAPGSRTQPARETRAATDFEDREGHRAPFTSSRGWSCDSRLQGSGSKFTGLSV